MSFKPFDRGLYSSTLESPEFPSCRDIWMPSPRPSLRPGADYTVYSFPDASQIAPADRQPLMDAMNAIIAVNWKATEPHWTAASSPCDKKYSLILVYERSGLVAFSVYRVMNIANRQAIYRSGTEVLPAHQGRGLYGFFTSQILKRTNALEAGRWRRALRLADTQSDRVGRQRQDLR